MDREFYYFNPRLTEKLNMIHRRPLTIMSAHKGVGKRTAVHAYLSNKKGCKIYQAIAGASFQDWLFDFLSLLETEYGGGIWSKEEKESIRNASDCVSRLAVFLKRTVWKENLFYVIETDDAGSDPRIPDFLYQLSKQGIRGLFLILLSNSGNPCGLQSGIDSQINLISLKYFLFDLRDIQNAYSEKGIPFTFEEAALVYRYTNGWAPLVSVLFNRIMQVGKREVWETIRSLPERWGTRIGDVQPLGYSEKLSWLLVRLSPMETFSYTDAERVNQEAGGILSGEELCRSLSVEMLPAFLYYDETTGLYHLHSVVRNYFTRSFAALPEKEQKRAEAVHVKLCGKETDITEDLKRIQFLLMQMRVEKADQYLQKMRLKGEMISLKDKNILLLQDCLKEIIAGHAQNTFAILNRSIEGCYESGRFREGEILVLGSIVLKHVLGGAYMKNMEALADCVLYRTLFQEEDMYEAGSWLRGIILLRNSRSTELETLMEMELPKTETGEALRFFFLALSRAERDEKAAEQDLKMAVSIFAKTGWWLPLVVFYDEFYLILPKKIREKERIFLDDVKREVNVYLRNMRMNHAESRNAYGARLTHRQLEAAKLAAEGLSNKEIALRMNISENTVKTTMRMVFRKLDVGHRRELQSHDF